MFLAYFHVFSIVLKFSACFLRFLDLVSDFCINFCNFGFKKKEKKEKKKEPQMRKKAYKNPGVD